MEGVFMDIIYQTVKNIIIYLILTTVVMNLLGNSTFKKYVGIFTGMILILIVIRPVMNFLEMGEKLDYNFNLNYVTTSNKALEGSIVEAENQQKKQIMLSYQEALKEEIKSMLEENQFFLVEFEIALAEDINEENYGEIIWMDIGVTKNSSKESEQLIMDKITIEKIEIQEQEEGKAPLESTIENLETREVKTRFMKLYDLEEEQINLWMVN